ncbi:MAG TPA: anti-sigma factor [Burkholderiales bacterium]|nr:anti-sigma factor [Burkholderiales bacterium]
MKVTENDLQAYVDDRLEPGARREVDAHLAEHPDDVARVQAYLEQNAALHAAFDPVLNEPVPDRLRRIDTSRRSARFAVAAGWLVVGVLVGWFANTLVGTRGGPAPVSLARQAAVAHAVYSPEIRHPVEVLAAEQEHLVNWLSKRLGAKLKAPVLTAEGFDLVGGRLLPGQSGAVAQFMYQDAKGKRLTLYVSRIEGAQRDTAFRFSQEEKVAVFYWIDGPLGYALSGDLGKPQLLEIATSVYKQINP